MIVVTHEIGFAREVADTRGLHGRRRGRRVRPARAMIDAPAARAYPRVPVEGPVTPASLVIVDAQRAFVDADSPWCTAGAADALAGMRRLAQAFGERTVLTRFVPPAAPHGSWRDYYERWSFARDAGPLWELVAPWTGADSVDVPTLSKWGPALAARVGAAPELVLCGISTDCCVLATALAAIDAGARVRVAADACAAEPGLHDAALAILRRRAPQLTVTTVAAELAAAAA